MVSGLRNPVANYKFEKWLPNYVIRNIIKGHFWKFQNLWRWEKKVWRCRKKQSLRLYKFIYTEHMHADNISSVLFSSFSTYCIMAVSSCTPIFFFLHPLLVIHNKSPFIMFFECVPDLYKLRNFGWLWFVLTFENNINKLDLNVVYISVL